MRSKKAREVNMCDKIYHKVYKGARLFKKYTVVMFAFIVLLLFSGCSLAREDAGDEAQVNTDCLIGAFVTTEYLNLFDMEAYINDHADEIFSGAASGNISDEEIIDTMEYNGRIYATVDKHGSTEPFDWEISFGDVEGICFFDAKWQKDGEEPFTMLTCGDEICDVNRHMHVSDEGESVTLTGTMYAVAEKNADQMQFYVNPVYQTEAGDIYVMSGTGWSLSGELGGSATMTLDAETSVTENGESQMYHGAVELTIEILKSEPTEIRIHFMDENLEILLTKAYAVGEVPTQLEAVEYAACIVVETVWADGAVTRELFELDEDESVYVETFYKTSEVALGKQSTEIIWK